jgi:hypothetical protein
VKVYATKLSPFWKILTNTKCKRIKLIKDTIQIIQTTRCNSYTSLLLDVYVWLYTFRASPAHHQGHTTALGASGFTVGEQRLERC